MEATLHLTKTWEQIIDFYQNLIEEHARDLKPMLDLVGWLGASDYRHGLFPYTSMNSLWIGHYPQFLDRDGTVSIV